MKVYLLLLFPILMLTGCTPTQPNTNYLSAPTSSPAVTTSVSPILTPAPTQVDNNDVLLEFDLGTDLNFDSEFDSLGRELQ